MMTKINETLEALTSKLSPWGAKKTDEYLKYFVSPSAEHQAQHGSYAHHGVFIRNNVDVNFARRLSNLSNTLAFNYGPFLPFEIPAIARGVVLQVIDQNAKEKTWQKENSQYTRVERKHPIRVSRFSYQPLLDAEGNESDIQMLLPIPIYASSTGVTVLHNNQFYAGAAKEFFERQNFDGGVEYVRVPWLSGKTARKETATANKKAKTNLPAFR